jgi:hypothetical protein
MAVTKQIYSLTAGFSPTDVINQLGQAFIDAGLMVGWHDTFVIGGNSYGVLECVYDPTKTYGTTYYLFVADQYRVGVAVGTGWDTASNTFTGTQFLDYYLQSPDVYNSGNGRSTDMTAPMYYNTTSAVNIYRYTSTVNVNQSWFVFQQGLSTSNPFTIYNPAQTPYPWLDLDLGMIPGFHNLSVSTYGNTGIVSFFLQENIGRAYPCGQSTIGWTGIGNGSGLFHGLYKGMYNYVGSCKVSGQGSNNLNFGLSNGSATILPIASSTVNPAYTQDYIPICSELPWTSFSSTPLATDFGVYMHYANNTLNFEDRFVVDPGVEEWEILTCANNATVTTCPSPTFLARVV